MPPSTVNALSPIQRWAREAVLAFESIRHGAATLSRLQGIPNASAADQLAALISVYQALGLPSPATTYDMQDGLLGNVRALTAEAESLAPAFKSLAAAVSAALTQAVLSGARNEAIVAVDDFGPDGVVYVQLPADPVVLLRLRGLGGATGSDEDSPIQVRGLAAKLPQGHHLLEALAPAERLQTSAGPAFVLGCGVMRPNERSGVPTPQVRPWLPTADVVALTAAARAQQLRQEQNRLGEEQWREAMKRADAEQRKADAPLILAARLEAAERRVAELEKEKGEAGR
jgi:hypothetical protein